jgi:hypothetical protein
VPVALKPELVDAFLERFIHFQDSVVTTIRLNLPRVPASARSASIDVQARDATVANDWRLVHITVLGVEEYVFLESKRYSYAVLSDGLALAVSADRCVLDLDPGPDQWSPQPILHGGAHSKQYVVGTSCSYDVLDGPFL